MAPICRFAPSPNGLLHLGHAWSAMRNERVAAACGAALRLRLEDIDRVRCTPALEAALLEDLAWFDFPWIGPVRRQRDRFAAYAAAFDRLAADGLLYPCFCTRGDIASAIGTQPGWPRDPDGSPLYPGTCRTLGPAERAARLGAGEPHALRLDMARALDGVPALSWSEFGEGNVAQRLAARPAAWGDAVLRRKDIPASYHIAVTLDDAADGVTDVVRGEDLLPATALHRLLQHLLGLPEPRYHHHRLVRDDTGDKLSKSRGSAALRGWRDAGRSPGDVRAALDAMMTAAG